MRYRGGLLGPNTSDAKVNRWMRLPTCFFKAAHFGYSVGLSPSSSTIPAKESHSSLVNDSHSSLVVGSRIAVVPRYVDGLNATGM